MEHELNKEELDGGEQIEGNPSVLDQPHFQHFIERRNIQPEESRNCQFSQKTSSFLNCITCLICITSKAGKNSNE